MDDGHSQRGVEVMDDNISLIVCLTFHVLVVLPQHFIGTAMNAWLPSLSID